jgi:hypothetical protein
MTTQTDLLALERQFWTGDADFYRRNVDNKCLVAFPDMAGVMSKEDIARSVKSDAPRWRDVIMQNKGLVEPMYGVAVLSYEASATRSTGEPYKALVSSGYVWRDGAWKLAFHQQTPLNGVGRHEADRQDKAH